MKFTFGKYILPAFLIASVLAGVQGVGGVYAVEPNNTVFNYGTNPGNILINYGVNPGNFFLKKSYFPDKFC